MKDKIKERLKTLLIILLSCSAICLTAMANSYYDIDLPFLGKSEPTQQSSGQSSVQEASRPLKMAVMNSYGRYGAACDSQTVDELYDRLGKFLGEALGTISSQRLTDSDGFKAALGRSGIFYEFPGSVPLSALARWLGTGLPEEAEDTSADLFVLSADDQGMSLCYRSDGQYYVCTVDMHSDVSADIESVRPNDVAFAFELEQSSSVYSGVDSFCLVVPRPVMPVAQARTVVTENRSQVVSAMSFNPYSDSSYTDSSGTEIFTANNSIISLGADGLVTYRRGDSPEGSLDPAERIELARATLAELASPGDAKLYFTGETREGDSYVLTFDYVLAGVKVETAQGYGATVTIRGGAVAELSLVLRSYQLQEETTDLMPSLQAAALCSGRLEVTYKDQGGESLTVGWSS